MTSPIYALNAHNQAFEVITDFDTSQLIDAQAFSSLEDLRVAYNSAKTSASPDLEDNLLTVEDLSDRLGHMLSVTDVTGSNGDIEGQSLIDFIKNDKCLTNA